jgi:Domain of unknown function (DUF4396)/Tetracyclin repressor-like, C-terminal domain
MNLFRTIFEPWEPHPQMLRSYFRARSGPGGKRLIQRGLDAVLPVARAVLAQLDPEFPQDLELILTGVVFGFLGRFTEGEIDVTDIVPGIEGAFFYVVGCREPLRGTHEKYVATRWRQVLGSTMHCVAGDGIGIIVGAAIGGVLTLSFWPDFLLEYVLGFGFGWSFFQAFAMRDVAGGSYLKSLKMTFLPELLSMNLLMTGMVITSQFAMRSVAGSDDPTRPQFWFIMSMALIVGFVCAYPINWWLVANHMKHGMMTVPMDAMSSDCQRGRHDISPAGAPRPP